MCPGWGRPPHPVDPATLTADHIIPRAAGGTDDPSNVAVLCGPCNSAKRDRLPTPTGEPCTLAVLVGIPAAGKSTWATAYAQEWAPPWVVLDDVPPSPRWVTLERARRRQVAALLAAGTSVIVDGCNLDERQRREWRRVGHINAARCCAVVFDVDLAAALDRNARPDRSHPVPPGVVGEYATRWPAVLAAVQIERWDAVLVVAPSPAREG